MTTVPYITLLSNRCLADGRIPRMWKNSILTPIFKGKGDPKASDNYRGIALTSRVYELLTCVLVVRLYDHLAERPG